MTAKNNRSYFRATNQNLPKRLITLLLIFILSTFITIQLFSTTKILAYNRYRDVNPKLDNRKFTVKFQILEQNEPEIDYIDLKIKNHYIYYGKPTKDGNYYKLTIYEGCSFYKYPKFDIVYNSYYGYQPQNVQFIFHLKDGTKIYEYAEYPVILYTASGHYIDTLDELVDNCHVDPRNYDHKLNNDNSTDKDNNNTDSNNANDNLVSNNADSADNSSTNKSWLDVIFSFFVKLFSW